MNETMNLLMNRKSVRVFEDKEITQDIKDQILAAAMRAPTAGNSMLYSIIDVTDQSIKDKLAVTCDNQPFIADAKMVLLFVADYHRWYKKFKQANCDEGNVPEPELSDLILATNDAVIAAHTACIAAESFGIGSCYIGDIVEQWETHRDLFKLPEQTMLVSMLVFGYPTEQQKNRALIERFPKSMIVFENEYHDLTDDELLEYKSNEKAAAFYKRKYISDFAKEMVRSTDEMFYNWNTK